MRPALSAFACFSIILSLLLRNLSSTPVIARSRSTCSIGRAHQLLAAVANPTNQCLTRLKINLLNNTPTLLLLIHGRHRLELERADILPYL